MKKHALLAVSALALAACGQQATTQTTETPAAPPAASTAAQMSDAEFAQAVANSDAYEIQTSELAGQRAARQDVKDFAAMMVREHQATTQELITLAPTLSLTAPTPQLDSAHQARLDTLRGQSGESFDDAYLDEQVEAHENAVRLFETYLAGAQAGPLRDWATTTLPKLRTHLTQAQTLENAT